MPKVARKRSSSSSPSGANQARRRRPASPANGRRSAGSLMPGRLADDQRAMRRADVADRPRLHRLAGQVAQPAGREAPGEPAERAARTGRMQGHRRHAGRRMAPACCRSRPSRTSPKDGTPARSTRSATPSARHARVLDLHVDRDHHRCVYTWWATAGSSRTRWPRRRAWRRADRPHGAARRPPARGRDGRGAGGGPRRPRAPRGGAPTRCASPTASPSSACRSSCTPTPADGRRPHDVRAGGPAGLQGRIDARRGRARPRPRPAAPDRRRRDRRRAAGARGLQRQPPHAATSTVARELARRVRARDGGLPGVRALGLDLPEQGIVQVSMNIEDPGRTPLYRVVEFLRAEAQHLRRRARPLRARRPAAGQPPSRAPRPTPCRLPELDASRVLEAAIARSGRGA